MKRLLTAACAFLLVCGVAMAEPRDPGKGLPGRPFPFKHRGAARAAPAIKSLPRPEGPMPIQPWPNGLVVPDRPDNMKAIAKTLAAFDAAAQPFRLSVRIVSAARGDARVPD